MSGGVTRPPPTERTTVPTHFSQRIRLVTRGNALMIAGAVVVIAAGLVWGASGSLTTRVRGQGLIVTGAEQVSAVESVATGVIRSILVKVGDHVTENQIVARLDQPELVSQVERANERLTELEATLTRLREEAFAERNQRRLQLEAELAVLALQIRQSSGRAERMSSLVTGVEGLLTRGNISLIAIEELRRARDDAEAATLRAQWQETQVRGAFLEFNGALNTRLAEAQRRVNDQRASTLELQDRLAASEVVRSQSAGHVEEIRVPIGAGLRPGDILMIVAREQDDYDVLAFLGPADGKRVKPGMQAHVIPRTVRKEEFGAIRGTVVEVSERALSEAAINAMVLDETLTREFVRGGAPIFARIRLEERPESLSGFAWWSGNGPDFRIEIGTVSGVEIVVRRHRPLALILPFLRLTAGL